MIEKMDKEGIAYKGTFPTALGAEEEAKEQLKKIYNIEDSQQIGEPIYLKCDTKDKKTIRDLYGEFIREYPYGCEPPMSEEEKEYLDACHERYLDGFEERYGYRPAGKKWTTEELDA